jgi:hypothetical protein
MRVAVDGVVDILPLVLTYRVEILTVLAGGGEGVSPRRFILKDG